LILGAEFNGTTAAESNVGFIGYGPTSAGGSARSIALGSYTGNEWKESMRLQSGGNVGIGTNDPSTPLSMGGSWGNSGLTIGNGSASSGLVLYSTPSSTYSSLRFATGASGAYDQGFLLYNHSANFMSFGTGRGTRMTIDSSGNVGIGTTGPTNRLEVVSGAADPFFFNGSYNKFKSASGWTYLESYHGAEIVIDNSGNYSDRTFTISKGASRINGGSPTPLLTVQENGNVNISGTVNAKYQDVAEWVPSSERLSAGTVVVLDSTKSNQVTASTVSYDTRVAGVVSEQPGIALGEKRHEGPGCHNRTSSGESRCLTRRNPHRRFISHQRCSRRGDEERAG
jgi:hypothetical protein